MKRMAQSGFGLWKILLTIALAVLFFAAFAAVASAATIYVPDDQGTIQDAVNAANPGDTIIVRDGTYIENVVVNKLVTLKGIDHPIVDASGSGNVITLGVDGITLEGFSAINSGSSSTDAGIKVISSSNKITGNTVSNNHWGISLWGSSSNNIAYNIVNDNRGGIFFFLHSNGDKIYLNNFADNAEDNKYNTYIDYLGNYWSDYTGEDANNDGIGDTRYILDFDKDNYQLMKRFENYFIGGAR